MTGPGTSGRRRAGHEHGWDKDDWPPCSEMAMTAGNLGRCGPIWLGEKSSVCIQIIERLYW